jgi:hypothetical protein
MASTFTYAYGLKTRDEANLAITDLYADGEISECDKPEVGSYKNKEGKPRYRILLAR